METYCVSCKKTTMNENRSVRKPKQNRLIVPAPGGSTLPILVGI